MTRAVKATVHGWQVFLLHSTKLDAGSKLTMG